MGDQGDCEQSPVRCLGLFCCACVHMVATATPTYISVGATGRVSGAGRLWGGGPLVCCGMSLSLPTRPHGFACMIPGVLLGTGNSCLEDCCCTIQQAWFSSKIAVAAGVTRVVSGTICVHLGVSHTPPA